MVRLSIKLVASPRGASRLVQALRSLMIAARLRPGCLGCSVWMEPDSTVHYAEEWATERDMRCRVRSDTFTSLLAVVEASEGPPRVEFHFVSEMRGLDYIEEIRRQAGEPGIAQE